MSREGQGRTFKGKPGGRRGLFKCGAGRGRGEGEIEKACRARQKLGDAFQIGGVNTPYGL